MSGPAASILEQAAQLPAADRASIIEELVSSLDRPDLHLDSLWLQEAKDRIAAYEAGQMPSYPADEVFAEVARL